MKVLVALTTSKGPSAQRAAPCATSAGALIFIMYYSNLVRFSGSFSIFLVTLFDLAILAVEGLSGIGDGKLPVDFHGLPLAFPAPAVHLVRELGLGGDASLQALPASGREVEFNLVKKLFELNLLDGTSKRKSCLEAV